MKPKPWQVLLLFLFLTSPAAGQQAPLANFACDGGVCQTSEAEVDRIQEALQWLQQAVRALMQENAELKKRVCS